MLPLARRGVTPAQIYVSPSLFEALPVRSIVVTHRDIVDSEYNSRHCSGAQRVAYDTLDELAAGIEAAVKSGAERKFVYSYWPVYDMLSHRYGSDSPEAFAALEAIDAAFEALSRGSRAPRPCSSPPPTTASSTSRRRSRSSCLRPSPRFCGFLCAASAAWSIATCTTRRCSARRPRTGSASAPT
jgi:hypothetical protein